MKIGFSKLLRKFRWKPRNGVVYKSWWKGDSHFGKSAEVTIIYKKKAQKGTFRVHNGICQVRIGKGHNKIRLFTPVDNVTFKKQQRKIDSIWKGGLGQNGYYGKEIQYTAKIRDSSKVTERL